MTVIASGCAVDQPCAALGGQTAAIKDCEPKELRSSACGNPGVPPKGILNGTQFNVGDKIRYRCVTGYVLDGHSLLTCITNAPAGVSVWDFPVPICRVLRCSGAFRSVQERRDSSTTYGSDRRTGRGGEGRLGEARRGGRMGISS
ncbi:hypothetical protein CRUP_008191 [Coryphaenoides rupestris]|nr:hypothetical protein CRUP_008191 [Coryphaenoides rupestris]